MADSGSLASHSVVRDVGHDPMSGRAQGSEDLGKPIPGENPHLILL